MTSFEKQKVRATNLPSIKVIGTSTQIQGRKCNSTRTLNQRYVKSSTKFKVNIAKYKVCYALEE